MNSITQFSKTDDICAVAVGKAIGEKTHCGILYNSELEGSKNSFLLHLGNPLHLYNQTEFDQNTFPGYSTTSPNFLWLSFSDVPTQLLKLIRTKCITIAKKNNALSYGVFHDEDTFFDAEGNLILGQDSNGLTCATFVKVVLKGSGVNVIDDTDWPEEREKDVDWLYGLIDFYKKDVISFQAKAREIQNIINKNKNNAEVILLRYEKTKILAKIDKLNKTIQEFREGTKSVFKRYRPEEIAGSSFRSFTTFPIKFEYPTGHANPGAGLLGKELLNVLPPSVNK